jgi:hypothetical protein
LSDDSIVAEGGFHMWVRVVAFAALLTVGLAQAAQAEPPKGELAALERKLVGVWDGQGGCDGKLVIRADGTYQLTGYGPAGDDSAGRWKVRWDALPPTLVLTCSKSGVAEEVGKAVELQLLRLNDKTLKVGYANPNGSPSGEYLRAKK